MKRNLINLLGIILMGIGTFLFLSPDFSAYRQQKNADQEIKAFQKEKKIPKEKDPFYQEALQYDQKIYKEGQKDLKDVWSLSHVTDPVERWQEQLWIYQDQKDACQTSTVSWSNLRKHEKRCCDHGRDIITAWHEEQ